MVYDLLSINDGSSLRNRVLGRAKSDDSYTISVQEGKWGLKAKLIELIEQGMQFRNCIFTTHGNSGVIFLGDEYIDAYTWYTEFYNYPFYRLFPFANTKLYFAGCDVADEEWGWKFLEAAARSLLRTAGGVASAWTSLGFGSPISGHVRHLWGDTRQVMISQGGDTLRFYENWELITDAGGYPGRPESFFHNTIRQQAGIPKL